MEFSTLFKRQLGLVYQERIEDEKVYITGNGAIIPYLVTNLCFLGLGTSQGVMSLPANLKVTKAEIMGQNLLRAEDEGQPLWLALKQRVKQRFSEAYEISSVEDVNSVNWDSVIIAMTNSNVEPDVPTLATEPLSAEEPPPEPAVERWVEPEMTRPDASPTRPGKAVSELRRMAHTINEDYCISCGACEPECPEEAISESEDTYIIDPAKCTNCEFCADVCPVDAISKAWA